MRITQQRAYVLHHYNYGETSLLLEVFTRSYGRLGLLAKGARRLHLRRRPLLEPFQPLLIDWTGKGELPVLSGAEVAGDPVFLQGPKLYCAFYMNELLIRLLHRHDAHELLFDAYGTALSSLQGQSSSEATLRVFEKRLLQEIGYGLVLENEMTDNSPIDPASMYRYVISRGPVLATMDNPTKLDHAVTIQGSTLLALAKEALDDAKVLQETKALMRAALGHHLAGRPLNSRKLFRDTKHIPFDERD